MLPHASVIHRFTVDRHVVETCIEASSLIRSVGRPDVLVVAALLHDIGKGGLTEHSVAGEPIARAVATRMGFDAEEVDLDRAARALAPAARRDRHHPRPRRPRHHRAGHLAGADHRGAVAAQRPHRGRRQGHLAQGLDVVARRPGRRPRPPRPRLARHRRRPARHHHRRRAGARPTCAPTRSPSRSSGCADGSRVTTIAHDRVGLLADFAAMFALQRMPVRAARVWAQGDHGVSVWEVASDEVDAAILRTKYDAIVGGRLDPGTRFAPRTPPRPATGWRPASSYAPRPASRPRCSRSAPPTARVSSTWSARRWPRLDVAVRSAHVDTLGPQAVDVFYLQEASAGALSETRAAEAAHAVRAALTGVRVLTASTRRPLG